MANASFANQAKNPTVKIDVAAALISRMFDAIDCDYDGRIEAVEVDEHMAQIWHPIDLDRSRFLSRAEYSRAHAPLGDRQSKALFTEADENEDGSVSAPEFNRHVKRMIDLIDEDKDREIERTQVGLKAMQPPKQPVRRLDIRAIIEAQKAKEEAATR